MRKEQLHCMNELVITNYKNSIISAIYKDKQMVQVSACRKKATVYIGNIYVARIDNIVKNINAAFVKISDDVSCYLELSGIKNPIFVKKQSEKKISIGDELIVQVIKEDVKTKAPVVTANFSLTGKYIALVHGTSKVQISKKILKRSLRTKLKNEFTEFLEDSFSIVIRTNAQYASLEEVKKELEGLIKEYKRITVNGIHQMKYSMLFQEVPPYLQQFRDSEEYSIDKMVTNIPAIYKDFQWYLKKYPAKMSEDTLFMQELVDDANELVIRYKINHFMDKALQRTVYLDSGATIVIEPTEALTVIDVNTGKAITKKRVTEDTFFAINMEAAKEIATQIRLRNLSGIILIDFINLSSEEQKETLKEELKNLFKDDPIQTEIIDFTQLGLMEITRKKVLKTLAEQIADIQIMNI